MGSGETLNWASGHKEKGMDERDCRGRAYKTVSGMTMRETERETTVVLSWGDCQVVPVRAVRMSGRAKPRTGLGRLSLRPHLALECQSVQWERSPGMTLKRGFRNFITQSVVAPQ